MLLSKWVGRWNMLFLEHKEIYEGLYFLLSGGRYNCQWWVSALYKRGSQLPDSPWDDFLGIIHSHNKDRRKVASTRQFIKAQVNALGGRASKFLAVEPAPRLFWNWINLGLSGQGRAVTHSGVVSNRGCFQSSGKLLPQVGREEFLIL